MYIQIDPEAGFCFGVKRAVALAEESLGKHDRLYCLGQIVHNEEEELRLQGLGLKTITGDDLGEHGLITVLIRAHGEPPSTYRLAQKNQITLIDATCPIVKKLQQKVKDTHSETKKTNGQIVIIGKKYHPEVIGLAGQANGDAIIIENECDLTQVDLNRPVYLFAQTTADDNLYKKITDLFPRVASSKKPDDNVGGAGEVKETELHFVFNDTICKHVKNRKQQIIHFAGMYDVIIFVGGKNSSNGRILFDLCLTVNPMTHFVQNEKDVQIEWFKKCASVGITGATSTPVWLLKKVSVQIEALIKNEN
jgi:4-hydroxy-3-methylbut-2-en-1-yl diphosphate reductase